MSISTPSYQFEPVSLEWGQTWPPRDVFVDLAAKRRVIPVVRRVLADELSAVGVYRQLAHGNYGSFILEPLSMVVRGDAGRSLEHRAPVRSSRATDTHSGSVRILRVP